MKAPVPTPASPDAAKENRSTAATEREDLFSREFLALCLVLMAAFGNVSVFFSFYHYLGAIDIPVVWRGFLVGLEPMAAFILRLVVLPWLHVRNAPSVLAASLALLVFVSCSYLWATTVATIIVLRVIHGAAFVLITASAIALLVSFIPGTRSGQGFSTLTIATMIPYAVIPPLSEALLPHVRTEADIYAGVSVFAVGALLLLPAVRGRAVRTERGADGSLMQRPTLSEIRENFRLPAVLLLLATIFSIYLAHATVFYFLKDLSLQAASGDVGLFFTLSMTAMIAVRLGGAVLFDRYDKLKMLQAGLACLLLCLMALPQAGTRSVYYPLAGVYGLCMGLILPLVNALVFTVSVPNLRGLNTNMTLFAMDAAYCFMPYLGGLLITAGMTFGFLFYLASGFVSLALAGTLALSRRKHALRHHL